MPFRFYSNWPPGRPLGLEPTQEEQLLQFIVSVAAQYRVYGTAWKSLLATGYEAVVRSFELEAVRPGKGEYLAWRMRQEMARVDIY